VALARFVAKNAFRNKRRSVLTILSVGFSMFLLTIMMALWRSSSGCSLGWSQIGWDTAGCHVRKLCDGAVDRKKCEVPFSLAAISVRHQQHKSHSK
jgi:hypothetical protein